MAAVERNARVDAYRAISYWHDSLPTVSAREPLAGSITADVVIVGGGFTGLWTAYYLTEYQPDLDVVVLEAEMVGFGASGRNGGWVSDELPMAPAQLAKDHGGAAVAEMRRSLWESIDEIGSVIDSESIDAQFHKGGSLTIATSAAQEARLRDVLAREHATGVGGSRNRWLDRGELRRRVRSDKARAGIFNPHCAAVHPARLARGLADVLESRGVRIVEATRASSIEPGGVSTDRGLVSAPIALRSVEAFEGALPDGRRRSVPLYSLMIATEPLSDEMWDEIGLSNRETFSDGRHMAFYGQRTADGRFAFGGRGAPYHFGSVMDPSFEQDPGFHTTIAQTLRWLFPQISDLPITHTWGGPMAMPRDRTASVSFDRGTGLGRSGGYGGAGVTSSHLAGQTMADLVLGRDTERTHLPWVGHLSPRWEPEPLRWIGITLEQSLLRIADRREATGPH